MAVSETKNPSALKIKLDCGLNDNGRTIVKSKTYSNLNPDAQAQDTLDVARAIISLQVHDELEINKQDNTILN
ncbi:Protein of uncharacterised function (DUF1659) [[Clostridium] sordellii]|uniref:DUF1659 domain-containing protein n=1 Tax=Paraclostridium sordellii TaxID=1505 RepID=UPI0005E090D3|nr:DUF1659 domain-containing protein [Paeniclostridium sordellii]CEQ30513.1 Protein of uncharacterised function (DUF1659) [[Clostridium] sordellii] [Paeniclostridium sordellii]